MNFKPTASRLCASKRSLSAFTLAEALAALAFLAIVIPVAVHGMQVASLAGQVAARKSMAARVADRLLNEMVVTGQWRQASSGGIAEEGIQQFRWNLEDQPWDKGFQRQLTLRVQYQVQGKDYEVRLTTLVDNAQQ